MTTLPYDIARCVGTTSDICLACRRREPGHPDWQVHVEPALTLSGCENFIRPIETVVSDNTGEAP